MVKDTLENQVDDMRYLYGKSVTIFSVASAIIGFAVPFSLTQLKLAVNGWFFVSLVLYGLLAIIAVFSLLPQSITTLRNPITIREEYWDMENVQFKMEILTHMEDAFTENKTKIKIKTYVLLAMTTIMALDVVSIILFIWRGITRN